MDEQHKRAVSQVAVQVKTFYEQGKAFKVYHGSTNSTRIQTFDRSAMVDVSRLDRILGIDQKHKTALVEPNVPMDKLVTATLAKGLVPCVVMEFPGITVGGGLQGGAGESSSFKHGTFNRILNWYEMVLGDGEVVTVSPHQHADLFWGAAGAYGSLGVVTCAEVQLMPAKRYVNVTYTPVHGFAATVMEITKAIKQPHDYIDAILYGPDRGVIITGRLSNTPAGHVQTFSKARDPWFYMQAEKYAKGSRAATEAVPIWDYLFRYDRGAFWMGKHAFTRLKTPFNALTRRLLDPLMHTRAMYEGLQASGISQECIIQDIAMPAKTTVDFLQFLDKEFAVYPLWLCPLPADKQSPLLSSALPNAKTLINVGVWSLYRKPYDQFVAANRKLEQAVRKLGGKKWLYAQMFYTQKEFWSLYNKQWYDTLRQKYHATTLPDIYQKTATTRVAVSAKRGVVYGLLGRKGIRIKKKP